MVSRYSANSDSKWRTAVRPLVYATYLVMFLSLLIFSILSILYMYKPTATQRTEPKYFETGNLTATEIACSFPGSGQYGITLQSTYYILLVFTVVLRHQQWLAAGIAASVLTYSGVAAIHLGVLLVAYGRSSRSWPCYNEEIEFPGIQLYDQLPICAGVYDPDYTLACTIVGAGLLAALPMAMWSSTFRNAAARPILVMWTLLLAFGHIFYNLIETDVHRHYQICLAGTVEPLPANDYIAVPFGAQWAAKFRNLAQGATLPGEEGPGSLCIYSCFASEAHIGRKAGEIGIYPAQTLETEQSQGSRRLGISYWLLYVVLSVASIIAERRPLSTWQHCPIYNYGRRAVQLISVSAYIGYVIWNGFLIPGKPMSEDFSSVGQWNAVAIVVMVVVAALAGRVAKLLNKEPVAAVRPAEEEVKDWSNEFGYAS